MKYFFRPILFSLIFMFTKHLIVVRCKTVIRQKHFELHTKLAFKLDQLLVFCDHLMKLLLALSHLHKNFKEELFKYAYK